MSVENYDAVLVTLLGDVAAAYVQIRTLERQIELTEQNVKLQLQTLTLADARFHGGTATDLDVEQARTVMKATEAQIPGLRISLRQANNQLCILMGMPPEDLTGRSAARDIPTAPPEVAVGIPADLLRRRPDVRRAERRGRVPVGADRHRRIAILSADFDPGHAHLLDRKPGQAHRAGFVFRNRRPVVLLGLAELRPHLEQRAFSGCPVPTVGRRLSKHGAGRRARGGKRAGHLLAIAGTDDARSPKASRRPRKPSRSRRPNIRAGRSTSTASPCSSCSSCSSRTCWRKRAARSRPD